MSFFNRKQYEAFKANPVVRSATVICIRLIVLNIDLTMQTRWDSVNSNGAS